MADVSKIKLPSGTTYNIKDTVSGYTTNTGTITKVQTTAGAHTTINVSSGAAAFNVPTKTSHLTNDSGFITNAGVTGVKGNAESNYRTGQVNLTAANIGAVSLSGDETISGNKNFSGMTAIIPASTFTTTNGVVIPASPTSIIQSPIPKYLWHDIWAFCRVKTPQYYTSNDGSTWTKATLEKRLFSHQEMWGQSIVLDSSIKGSRWEWKNAGFYASMASWLVLGITYRNPSAHFDVLLETSEDGTTWTTLTTATDISYQQTPIWIKNNTSTQSSIRLTITWNNNSASNATLGLCSIRFLTHRWGNQGQGSEYEYPYIWDSDYNISPLSGSSFVGNLTGNVQATTINGVTVGSSPKFTDTDEKVSQSYKTASEYTYWRPLLIGYSAGSAATFTPSSTTNLAYTFSTLKVQPSTGTIRVNNLALYKGSYTTTFTPTTLTADRTITIPNNTGTMALTSDIPSVPAWALESSKPSYTFSEIGSKPTTISGYGITDAYTKTEVDNKVSAVLRYKGVKAAVSNLPTTGNVTGDVWHVTATSGEYAWDGTEWQELGTAITIPAATGSNTTGITVSDHSTTSIYGVSSSTTSVTGVSGSTSVYGVKSGTNSTTTASKASGANGTAPTLGTAITVRGVKTGTNSTTTASKASGANGTASSWTFEEKTIPNVTSAGSASSWTFEEKSIPNVTAAGSGSASLTFTMDTTDTKKLKIAFSHTHTAPTIGTAIKVQSKSGGSNGTAPTLGTAIKVQSKSGGSNGTAPTWSFTDVTVPIRADADTSIPNVTSVGSASTWSFTDVTVPIRADSATTVPTAASSATTVPIKNGTATTVVTSKTHTVNDSGHTHTI